MYPFGSTVAFTASICLGNEGHAQSQGGRQLAAAKVPCAMYSILLPCTWYIAVDAMVATSSTSALSHLCICALYYLPVYVTGSVYYGIHYGIITDARFLFVEHGISYVPRS